MLNQSATKTSRLPRLDYLFLLLVCFEFIRLIFLITGNRLVVHDSFCRFTLQYYFLNHIFINGEFPHWIPYLTHGSTAYWWHALQGMLDFFAYSISLTGDLFRNLPYLATYHIGIFFSRLILLTGCWLLGTRLFKSKCSIFLVCVSVMAVSVSESQVYFNFYFYYALPLILYLFHRFIEKGNWWYALAAINLYAVQNIGNAAYFIPISSFLLVLYTVVFLLFNKNFFRTFLGQLSFGRSFWICLMGALISLGVTFYVLQQGMPEEMVRGVPGRGMDGTNTFQALQDRAADIHLGKWLDLALGISLHHDGTAYVGIFGLALILIALFKMPYRYGGAFLLIIIALFAFSRASLLTLMLYHSWPLMKFYRHLHLLMPLIGFWLCFLVGFGCDYLCTHRSTNFKNKYLIIVGTLFLAVGSALWLVSSNIESIIHVCEWMGYTSVRASYESGALPIETATRLFQKAAIFHVLTGIALGLGSIVRTEKQQTALVVLLVLLHCADLGLYGNEQIKKRTVAMDPKHHQLLEYQALPFLERRNKNLSEDASRSRIITAEMMSKGVVYWNLDAYMFNDQAGTFARTDQWLIPYDKYLRMFWNQSLDRMAEAPVWINHANHSIKFPFDKPQAMKFSGLSAKKIQFYTDAYQISDDQKLVELMTNQQYAGNILFLSEATSIENNANVFSQPWTSDNKLSDNHQLNLLYELEHFDSNRFNIRVENPLTTSAWMFYSDIWHPDWKATRNKQAVPIHRAQMAYKAIELVPGMNQVEFRFFNPVFELIIRLVSLNCAIWLFVVIALTIQIGVGRTPLRYISK